MYNVYIAFNSMHKHNQPPTHDSQETKTNLIAAQNVFNWKRVTIAFIEKNKSWRSFGLHEIEIDGAEMGWPVWLSIWRIGRWIQLIWHTFDEYSREFILACYACYFNWLSFMNGIFWREYFLSIYFTRKEQFVERISGFIWVMLFLEFTPMLNWSSSV